MKQKQFLQFNGKVISYLDVEGEYYIAIKPICEALGINYNRQYKTLREDDILGQLLAIQPMVGADFRFRKMVALPEMYVYGWLFRIQSDNQLLQNYKKECYKILWDHFQGTITKRVKVIKEKIGANARVRELDSRLRQNPDYLEMLNYKGIVMRKGKELKEIDDDMVNRQLVIFP